jgi:hypothetical protein
LGKTNEELGILSSNPAFDMEDLRKVQTELAHVARVTTMGELAASIAHAIAAGDAEPDIERNRGHDPGRRPAAGAGQ